MTIYAGLPEILTVKQDGASMTKNYYCMATAAALLVLAALIGTVAGAATSPVVEWESWLGSTGHESIHDIYESGDGGYLLAGNSTSANGTGDAYLIKIDGNGTKVWEKTYGGSGEDVFMGVEPANNGFVMVGTTATGANAPDRLLLVKVDLNGTKVFETNASGRGIARGLGVLEVSDGSFIAVGLSAASATAPNDIYLAKFSATGAKTWEKYFGGQGEDRAFAIVEAADGGYVVTGAMTRDGQTTADAYLLKIDKDGAKAWEKFYGVGDRQEVGFDLTRMADGGFLVVGRSFTGPNWWGIPESSEIYVLRTDRDGVKQWEQTYGGAGFDRAWDAEELSDGYAIFGSKTMTDGTEDFLLMKLTKAGMVTWEQTLTAGAGHDRGYAMQETPDGGWIVAGSSDSKGAGGRDIWVVKLAPEEAWTEATTTSNATATANATANATATLLTTTPAPTVSGAPNATTAAPTTTRAPLGLAAAFAALGGAALLAARRR